MVNKHNKERINEYLQNYIITYGDKNIQESRYISKTGLTKLLKNTQIGRLSVEQRIMQNNMHSYLGIDLLPTEEQDTKHYKEEWYDELDSYTTDVVKNTMVNENIEWFRMCSKCNKHYPLTSRFFAVDNRIENDFAKVCRVCTGYNKQFTHQNNDRNTLKKQQSNLQKAMVEDQIMQVHQAYKNGLIKSLPDCYENRESYLRIIKELYNTNSIERNNLTLKYLIESCGLKNIGKHLNMLEIYTYLFGENFYYYAWLYPKFQFKEIKLTYEIADCIVKNYLKEYSIVIKDIFTFDYADLFKKCRIRKLTDRDMLGFIVQFYEKRYPGYLFKTYPVNYYKDDANLLFDLKYLIEKDMKLDIIKVPLYLTKNVLRMRSNSLYRNIVTKGNGSLYEWIDKLYPNQFIDTDFEINAYRNEFDSDTELYIHELLCENFKNVIYNQKHTSRTITLDGMIPDWLIMTETGVWVVEYFGLYEERQYGKNSRVTDYIDKTKKKIERYKRMKGYKFIFIYPNDIGYDSDGCRDIIEKMKENPYLSML